MTFKFKCLPEDYLDSIPAELATDNDSGYDRVNFDCLNKWEICLITNRQPKTL